MGQHSAITCIEQTQVQAVHAALPYSEKVPTRYCQERALVFQQFQTNVDIVDMKKTPQERALYIPGAIFKKKTSQALLAMAHGTSGNSCTIKLALLCSVLAQSGSSDVSV